MSKVWCPVCLENDTFFQGASVRVVAAIKPEQHVADDGSDHIFDPKTVTTHYICALDHRWSETESRPCWCGWQVSHP